MYGIVVKVLYLMTRPNPSFYEKIYGSLYCPRIATTMKAQGQESGVSIKPNGPMGLGDPDDMKLRRVERDVLIKNKVRAAAKERCKDLIEKFGECALANGVKLPFVCRSENQAQMACLSRWFYDKELNEQMTQEYLKERSEYRRTGVPKECKLKRV